MIVLAIESPGTESNTQNMIPRPGKATAKL